MAITRKKQKSPIFISLFEDNRKEIYRRLPLKALSLFALTCKSALDDIRKNFPLHQMMLHLAAFAAPDSPDQKVKSRLAVMRLLKLYPDLLFAKGFAKDPAGHNVGDSIYKIFLGAGDVWAQKQVREKIIPLIPNGEAIAEVQHKEQFPHHDVEGLTEEEKLYDDRNIAQIAQAQADLDEIAAAFTEDPCTGNNPTKQRTIDAFNKLYEHLAPKEGDVITTGLHSPPKIMEIIHKFYFDHYRTWTEEQQRVYSLFAIGKTQKTSTAVDAQCHKKGLVKIGDNFEPDRTVSYFTSSGVPEGLGDSFFIDIYYGRPLSDWAQSPDFGCDRSGFQYLLGNYVEQKKQYLLQSSCEDNTETRTLSV